MCPNSQPASLRERAPISAWDSLDYFAGLDISLTLGVRTRVLIPAASAVSVRRGVFRLRVRARPAPPGGAVVKCHTETLLLLYRRIRMEGSQRVIRGAARRQ